MEDDVKVTDGGVTLDIPESLYRTRGYKPDLESLRCCTIAALRSIR